MLPSNTSKRAVCIEYVKGKSNINIQTCPDTTFYSMWQQYLVHKTNDRSVLAMSKN